MSRFSFEARRTCWRHVRADKKERGAARPEKQTAFNTTVRSITSAEMSARTSSAVERRKKTFKKTIDADESRRKREDNIIELRKAKRDESLQKKRATNMGPAAGGIEESNRSSALVAARVTHFHIDLSSFSLLAFAKCADAIITFAIESIGHLQESMRYLHI